MKSKIKPIAWGAIIACAVIVLPLAYSIFYLGAFWDPYNKLSSLKVAVVNEDSGAVINGETRNLGSELVDKLQKNEELGWTVTGQKDATDGVEGSKYYAEIIIPQDFSTKIASADSTNKQTATILYASNEKRNYLASQIMSKAVLEMEKEVRSQVNGEITKQLSDRLKSVPTDMKKLMNGLGTLYDGSLSLKKGASQFSAGQTSLLSGVKVLNTGLGTLSSKSTELSSGLFSLQSGIAQEQSGTKQLYDKLSAATQGAKTISDSAATGIPALQAGVDQLSIGAHSVSDGITQYTDGVNSLIAQNVTLQKQIAAIYSSKQLNDTQKVMALGQIVQAMSNPDTQSQLNMLSQSGQQLKSGASKVATGTDQLKTSASSFSSLTDVLLQMYSGLQQLKNGAGQLSDGYGPLATGAQQLYAGSKAFSIGLVDAKDGSNTLLSGASDLKDGAGQLMNGSKKIADGLKTAKDSVNTSITNATQDLSSLNGLDTYASDPVYVKSSAINPVSNYGTAFAPYFMSLSLYVGALIMFVGIYMDTEEKIKMLSRNSGHKLARVAFFSLIGVAQAILLALIVHYGLGLKVANLPVYYLSCVLVSIVFISIVEFFFVCLKDAGKFLAMLLLILQLTSCGGTFPMETVPKFFQVLYPYMPMTYSVQLFKESISGFNGHNALQAVLVLVFIFILFTGMTMAMSAAGKRKQFRIQQKKDAALLAQS